MLLRISIICLKRIIMILIILFLPQISHAKKSITIPLKMNFQYVQNINFLVDFRKDEKDSFPKVVAHPGTINIGEAPGNVKIWAKRNINDENSYLLKIDTDGDENFKNEKEYELLPDSSIVVKVKRVLNNREKYFPYLIRYSRYKKDNSIHERLHWHSHYRAEGRFEIDSCQTFIGLLDLNADGIFDYLDSRRGTNLQIDTNNDGKIWGRDEHIIGVSIFKFCDKYFTLDSIERDGASLTLIEVDQKIPEIGENIPGFILTATNGQIIDSEKLKGEIILLDFWASWCKPCIAGFTKLKDFVEELNNKIIVISINVDEEKRYDLALKVVKEYNLKWSNVFLKKGGKDRLWKLLGSMENNHLGIPFYILIDRQGIIRYAGSGGSDLI